MIIAILLLFAVTCIPALELRASIPIGFFALDATCGKVAQLLGLDWAPVELDWWWIVLICTISNIILGMLVFEVLLPLLEFTRRWKWFDKKIWPHFEKRREKLRPAVEKYGEWGVAVFIGIPLPGTGAVTGALGAFLLGFKRKKFYLANMAGVLMAAACVTIVCLCIQQGVVGEDSWIRKLFIKEF